MDDSDYSNEGRNYSTPTGTPAGNTQSPGGGWMGDGATVADSSIAATTTAPDQSTAETARLDRMNAATGGGYFGGAPEGGGGGSAFANVATWDNLKTAFRTVLGIMGMASGGVVAASSAINLGDMYRSGAYGKFGSAAPSTNVSSGSGATTAFSAWNSGDQSPSYRGSDSAGVYQGSPVIGWQGAIVNAPAPATPTARATAPGDFLGFTAIAPRIQPTPLAPQGASGGTTTDTTGMVALALGLGLLAALS